MNVRYLSIYSLLAQAPGGRLLGDACVGRRKACLQCPSFLSFKHPLTKGSAICYGFWELWRQVYCPENRDLTEWNECIHGLASLSVYNLS